MLLLFQPKRNPSFPTAHAKELGWEPPRHVLHDGGAQGHAGAVLKYIHDAHEGAWTSRSSST